MTSPSVRLRLVILSAGIVLVSGVLRLTGLEHMEYKQDEQVMFEAAMAYREGGPWPWLGMMSSEAGLRNPGLSMGAFGVMAVLTGAGDPVALDRIVGWLGTLAIAAVCVFALRRSTPEQQEQWLWVAALAGANVFLVTMHRKLWAQSIVSLPLVAFVAAWWLRDRRWAAFAWGILGALIAQIHMAGMIFGFAVAAATGVLARGPGFRRVRWVWWWIGAAIGALPMLPWLRHFYEWRTLSPTGGAPSFDPFAPGRFVAHWLFDGLGLPGRHSLGREHLRAFLEYPLAAGVPTFGVLLAHAAIAVVAAVIAVGVWRNRPRSVAGLRDLLLGRRSQGEFLLLAAFGAYGVLICLLG